MFLVKIIMYGIHMQYTYNIAIKNDVLCKYILINYSNKNYYIYLKITSI